MHQAHLLRTVESQLRMPFALFSSALGGREPNLLRGMELWAGGEEGALPGSITPYIVIYVSVIYCVGRVPGQIYTKLSFSLQIHVNPNIRFQISRFSSTRHFLPYFFPLFPSAYYQ